MVYLCLDSDSPKITHYFNLGMTINAQFKLLSVILFISIFFVGQSFGQTCPTCSPTVNYQVGNNSIVGTPTPPTNNVPSTTIARFFGSGSFSWEVQNTTKISGLVVETGVNLTLGIRNSNTSQPAFQVEGTSQQRGCIIVRPGATLDLAWISGMKDVDICVQDGASIIFDSDGGSTRNKYTFDGVKINLGNNAKLDFGNADIDVVGGGLQIDGWTGSGFCNGNTPPSGGSSGNITWDPTRTRDICEVINVRVLPVELITFLAKTNIEQRTNIISWSTAKEWENSHFEIERAVNNINSWEKIGEVNGMGWSDMPVAYEFIDDKLPLTGGHIFYRLKQVDFDGTFSYSAVVSVRVQGVQVTKGVWRAFPNPTTGERFNLELANASEYQGEEVEVRLVSPGFGSKTFTGRNMREVSSSIQQELQKFSKGVYILEVQWGQKVEFIKILKQ